LKEHIAKTEEVIKTFEEMLPSEQEVPALFKDLDNIANSTGVKFEWIGPESWTEGEHYIRFLRKIKIRGGYHQIGLFINRLENSQRFIRVDDVEIKSIPDTPYIHEASMIVSTFVAKEGM